MCWLLREVSISAVKDGGLLLGEVAECHPRVLLLLSLKLVQHEVPSLLGYDLLPLALSHLLSHLDPLRLGVIDLRGHEGFRLGFLDDLDSQLSCGSHLGWLLSRSRLGVATGVDVLHTIIPWCLLLLLFLMALKGHLGVALDRLPPVELIHLVVGSCDYLGGLGAASPVAGRGAFGDRGLHESGTTGGSQIR